MGLEALLARHWWRPGLTPLTAALLPLSWLYRALAAHAARAPARLAPRPVIVVGNLVVGGAGKTPTVIALVQSLRAAGRHPGVVSRGHGGRDGGVQAVTPSSDAEATGDEPLLIRRRTGVPVWIGRDRLAAAQALCRAHPEVDVLVADDGLQHHALARDIEIVVFDERGVGNGRLLPAGPLREPMPRKWPVARLVLYNATAQSTPVAGARAARTLAPAVALADWRAGRRDGVPLSSFAGRRVVAAAGIAAPQRFFAMLEAAGLTLDRLPLPDHHPFDTLPWPAATPEGVLTEKDAVKLDPARVGATRVWVVGLDFALPGPFVADVLRRLDTP
jgi:tetraacyldisaccharide 4'-kinase